MTLSYWPEIKEVENCFVTEAEELKATTLLAVHEPMQLERRRYDQGSGDLATEHELFEYFIQSEFIHPVVGEAGFGKSHVVRWIDAQLRKKNENDKWHIVRIPKNASLREALEHLLDGLSGKLFDDTRKKIDAVGDRLRTKDLANHLVVFIGTRLDELYREVQQEANELAMSGQEIDLEKKKWIDTVKRHAKPNGLPSLLKDPNFEEQLVGEGNFLYQMAKRLTEGSTDDETENYRSTITAEDLELRAHHADLSKVSQEYIRDSMIRTNSEKLDEAVHVLNEVLSDASHAAFQTLFQLNTGNFIELFTEVRVSLAIEKKALFVLVEDMATISAIEKVLIDCLLVSQKVKSPRGQPLCPLHSIIAVTTGYPGYQSRRNTIASRVSYEWHINRAMDNEEETYDRIENFCGRYLNAARYGEDELELHKENDGKLHESLNIWQSPDKDEETRASFFGTSPKGFPLFPFSKLSLRALTDVYCRPNNQDVEFNPRQILQRILYDNLKLRDLYKTNNFPSPGLESEITCPFSLEDELRQAVGEEADRAYVLAAIWGYESRSLSDLARVLPSEIAGEFNLPVLQKVLTDTSPTPGPVGVPRNRPPKRGAPQRDKGPVSAPKGRVSIEERFEDWFQKKNIPHTEAQVIRSSLLTAIENRKKEFSDWYGLSEWPNLKQGQRILINIAYCESNVPGSLLTFGSEKILSDRRASMPYRQFMLAVLRRNEEQSDQRLSWNYDQGLNDFISYQNFLDDWLPEAMSILSKLQREKAADMIGKCLGIAYVFDPGIGNASADQKINTLVTTSELLRKQTNKTGFEEWDNCVDKLLLDWDQNQRSWLDQFSTNRHALDGHHVKKILRGHAQVGPPVKIKKLAQDAATTIRNKFEGFQLLEGCSTQQEFADVFKSMLRLVEKLESDSQFKDMPDGITGRKYINKLKRLLDGDFWESSRIVLSMREPYQEARTFRCLQKFDAAKAEQVNECLDIWKEFFQINLPRLKSDNAAQGSDERKKYEKDLKQLIVRLGNNVSVLEKSVNDASV